MTDLAHGYLGLDGLFSAEELALRDRVRAFVRERTDEVHTLIMGRAITGIPAFEQGAR